MNIDECNYEYRQINSKQLIVEKGYQRDLDMKTVAKILANFDPNLVNPIKASYRNGKFYVFDGQHTLAALKTRNNNKDLMVDCKVFYGLTDIDESHLFSKQRGVSRNVNIAELFKSELYGGNKEITNLVKVTEKQGFIISFNKSMTNYHIRCLSKIYNIYKVQGVGDYVAILQILKRAWDGDINSLKAEIIGGLAVFHKKYKGSYDEKRLVSRLQNVSPSVIIREGKSYSSGGDTRFAKQILMIYNKNIKKKLDDRF